MSELLIELFSEEIPPNLHKLNTRTQLKKLLNDELSTLNLKYKILEIYSTPTRLTVFVSGLPNKVKVFAIRNQRTKKLVLQKTSLKVLQIKKYQY